MRRAARRVFVWLAAAVLALLLVILLAGGSAWWWAGRDDSLGHALAWAQRWLPPGDTLEVSGVQGALRRGGRIALVRWTRGGLQVEARDVELAWQPRPLFSRRVQLDLLRATQVLVRDARPASPAGTMTPPDAMTLPVQVDTPLDVAVLRYEGTTTAEARELAAHYAYDGQYHRIRLDRLLFAEGRYRGDATLQAVAPLALRAQLEGDLSAPLPPLPGQPRREPLKVQAHAEASGTLAGLDAALDVKAHLVPQSGKGLQADMSALVHPWQPQPVASAQARWEALDLSVLWPRAPRTQLEGDAQVQPLQRQDGLTQKWQVRARTMNRAAGPWDQQRLPLASLQVQATTDGDSWDIAALDAGIGGGRLKASGRWARTAGAPGPAGWQGQASLERLNPAALHSRLAEAALDGTVTARASSAQVIDFVAQLQPSVRQPSTSKLNGLQITQARADGQWDGETLTLKALRLQTRDAAVEGNAAVRVATLATRGQLKITAPGAQLDVQGSLGPQAGEGSAALRISDAARTLPWLTGLPGIPAAALDNARAAGNAEARLSWQGGWQQEARGLHVQAQVLAPRLDYGAAPDSIVRLRQARIDIIGVPSALALDVAGRVERATQRLQLKVHVDGGRAGAGHWTARLTEATAALQSATATEAQSGWRAQLRAPVGLDWQTLQANRVLAVAAGEIAVQAPGTDAATATLSWQPARWSHDGARASFSSKGQLRGLPQAWLEQLGQTQLAALGLAGDLLFDGEWDVESAAALRFRASLARRSGDIQLQGGDGADRIRAGVRDARVSVATEGTDGTVRAILRWDSAAAGQVDANLTSRIAQGPGEAVWPGDAPLGGTLSARLPQVGIWSALAPPGWRLRGTLDAQVALSGTRDAPQWHGTLAADELALRSVVDGIEFSRGRLRATLDGQRLDIGTFTLQGASGAADPSTGMSTGRSAAGTAAPAAQSGGGTLSVTGNVQWLPPSGKAGEEKPAGGIASRVRMSLLATARSLRVSARADRRLVVSGTLQAQLEEARLRLRGQLKADQALFILPDDTAPGLSDDVVIRKPGASSAPGTTAVAPGPEATGRRVVPDVELTLDLGPDFRLQGRGIATRLAGTLTLRSTPVGDLAGTPRLTGDIRTVSGSYRAYGQNLDIEQGLLRFTGPYDNPTLNILAIRPNLSQRVGVQITGTALLPRVRLYAEPDLPDAEKLAWLVLGRGAANGGAEAAVLQQAALALLGGNGKGLSGGLAEQLGLDELSFRGAASNVDGSTTSAAVTLGKRLSRNFYVAYERSLAGTLGTFYIFYDLSRRFTLRAQTGEQSAIDLIFTLTYD